MEVKQINVQAYQITGSPGLDPIRVILQDIAPGKGRVTIECFGDVWAGGAAYFGAIGDRSILDFVRASNEDYLFCAVALETHRPPAKRNEPYVRKVVSAALAGLRQIKE